MDTKFVDDIRARISYEGARTAPPEDFPKLPDLPLGRYTDTALFELELERVFKRRWVFAGHTADLPKPGSYKTLDIPLAPVLLVRDKDGQIRAFLNACRHRGAPVVRETRGTAKYLVCQFHAWSYDLTGRLVNVPHERDFNCLVREDRSLAPVRCETWGEFIFINLDPDAKPLLEDIDPLATRFSDLMEGAFRPVTHRTWEMKCNWKIAVEAFIEFYHFSVVHKNSAAPFIFDEGGVMLTHPNGHSSGFIPYRTEITDSAPEVMAMFFPSDVPQIPGLSPLYREANPSFFIFPNLVSPTDITGFPILVWWPLAVDRTRMDMFWYGSDWGDGERPAGWELKLGSWDLLMSEDTANLEPIQRSIEAAAHSGVPLNYQERRIWQFHADIDREIGPESIPSHLQVPDLLAGFVEP